MRIDLNVDTSAVGAVGGKLQDAARKAEQIIAVQIQKDTEPFVPMLTGSLVNRTQAEDGEIIYPGPYARYLYYGKVMVDSITGKGAAHYINEYGEDVFFFRKGATLTATDRDLVYTKSFHPDAQGHWMEASEAINKEKWTRNAKKALGEILNE